MILTPSLRSAEAEGNLKNDMLTKNIGESYVYSQDSQACRVAPKTGNGAPENIERQIQGLELNQTSNVQSQVSLQLFTG